MCNCRTTIGSRPKNFGSITNRYGQSVTSSGVKRALQQADYAACFRASLCAQSATGLPWDQDRSTPSGLASSSATYQSIIANQQKRAVRAAQACAARQPSQNRARAPVFKNPKTCDFSQNTC